MDKILTIAILGFGARGHVFAEQINKNKNAKLTYVIDILDLQLKDAVDNHGVKPEHTFKDYKEFYKMGKVCDAIIVSTQDKDHIKHVMPALKLGYNVLIEKPVATTLDDCNEILEMSKKHQNKVMVAHVLRYTPFYKEIKNVLNDKLIGDVIHVYQEENVGYWHMAHSYVRGAWRNKAESSPMILAKCSHDFDIINWLLEKDCKELSSFGSLNFFNEQNKPKEATNYCVDCPLFDTCPYNAFTIYDNHDLSILGSNSLVNGKETPLKEALSSKQNPYGRCVFSCDNDVVDHQIVNMNYESNVTANLTMMGFGEKNYRFTKIYGTYGEIYGNMEEQKIHVQIYGKPIKTIDLKDNYNDFSYHQGGDNLLMQDFINYCLGSNATKALTTLEQSLASHKLSFAAEESRLSKGEVIKFKYETD